MFDGFFFMVGIVYLGRCILKRIEYIENGKGMVNSKKKKIYFIMNDWKSWVWLVIWREKVRKGIVVFFRFLKKGFIDK